MTGAAELFVVALARASKRARRHLRGLTGADKDDVLSTAILWCWEMRATYNPSVALDDWFLSAIRHARRAWERGEARQHAEMVETIAAPDDTSARAEQQQAIEHMIASMDSLDHAIVDLRIEGAEEREIGVRLNVSLRAVQRRIGRMRDAVPERRDWQKVLRVAPEGSDNASQELAPIDKAIEKLEFAPPAGKDCIPCWRCRWFDGFMPAGHRPTRMKLVEPDVRAAVLETEARKVEIAGLVRAGLFKR